MRRRRASWRLAAAAPSSIPDLYIQPQAREEAPMELYRFRQGSLPLLVSMPHCGTHVPPAIAGRLTEIAQSVPDTDWHMPRLYDFLPALGASVIERSEARRVGKECVSTCSSRWAPYP